MVKANGGHFFQPRLQRKLSCRACPNLMSSANMSARSSSPAVPLPISSKIFEMSSLRTERRWAKRMSPLAQGQMDPFRALRMTHLKKLMFAIHLNHCGVIRLAATGIIPCISDQSLSHGIVPEWGVIPAAHNSWAHSCQASKPSR